MDALKRWHIGQVIRAYRLHPHHRQPISQAVVANWLDLTQAQLSRIENGSAVTDLAKLIPIVNTLAIPADLLWFKVPGSGTDKSPECLSEEEDAMHRRQVLQGLLTGSVVSAAGLSSLAHLESTRQSLDRLFEGSDVSPSTLERWDVMPSEYGQRYQMVAPGALLEDVASDFVELQYLLGLKQTTSSRMTLCRVSSQLATLAGIFLAAQGNKASAQNWFHTAGLAASEAADRQLAGLALVRSSIVSLYHGAPKRALSKLTKAQALLGGTPTPWRARALVVEARC